MRYLKYLLWTAVSSVNELELESSENDHRRNVERSSHGDARIEVIYYDHNLAFRSTRPQNLGTVLIVRKWELVCRLVTGRSLRHSTRVTYESDIRYAVHIFTHRLHRGKLTDRCFYSIASRRLNDVRLPPKKKCWSKLRILEDSRYFRKKGRIFEKERNRSTKRFIEQSCSRDASFLRRMSHTCWYFPWRQVDRLTRIVRDEMVNNGERSLLERRLATLDEETLITWKDFAG